VRHVIRYHRSWGPVFFGLAVLEVIGFVVTRSWLSLVLAAPTAFLGYLYVARPLLVLEDGAIHVKNLWGFTRRRFSFDSFAGIEVERDALSITRAGQRERLRISPWMTARRDLDALAAAVRAARASQPPAPESEPAPASSEA